jgi:hypothetical protein
MTPRCTTRVYRFDDEMLVNVCAYGILAAYTPVMHLRQADGAFFSHRRTGGTGRRACRWTTPIPSAARSYRIPAARLAGNSAVAAQSRRYLGRGRRRR